MEDAAVREVREESGIAINKSLLKDIGDEEYSNRYGRHLGKNYIVTLDGITDNHQPGRGDGENEPFQWIPISQVNSLSWAFGQDKKINKIANTLKK